MTVEEPRCSAPGCSESLYIGGDSKRWSNATIVRVVWGDGTARRNVRLWGCTPEHMALGITEALKKPPA